MPDYLTKDLKPEGFPLLISLAINLAKTRRFDCFFVRRIPNILSHYPSLYNLAAVSDLGQKQIANIIYVHRKIC